MNTKMPLAFLFSGFVAIGAPALAQAPDAATGPGQTPDPIRNEAATMPGSGIWGSGMMESGGHGMSPMMFVMIDADGDGAISRAEMEAVHARMFDLVDADKDGLITAGEIGTFRRKWTDDN